jgi:carboxymethylenebutenolidase
MDQRIIELYDSFTHGGISRREFLDRLAGIAGSSAAALALLPLLQNDYARAAIVAPDDARLAIDEVSYDAGGTRISDSIRTSRTWRGGSRSQASSPTPSICSRRLAARRLTRTRAAR